MENKHSAHTEENRALIGQYFDAVARRDKAAADALHAEDYVLELAEGQPGGGVFKGAAEAAKAGQQMGALLGVTRLDVKEIIADGPERVVILLETHGVDGSGEPWSMSVLRFTTITEGLITKSRLFFQDTARLQEIARSHRESPAEPPAKFTLGVAEKDSA